MHIKLKLMQYIIQEKYISLSFITFFKEKYRKFFKRKKILLKIVNYFIFFLIKTLITFLILLKNATQLSLEFLYTKKF